MLIRRLHLIAITSLVGLIILSLAWGGTLVSFRPDGYWSILKSLPLMLVFPGILKGRIYTCQYSSLLILAYLTEGIVRSLTSQGLSAHLAAVEILLSLAFFISDIFYAKLSRHRYGTPLK